MKGQLKIWLVVIAAFTMLGCEEIFETDISDEIVELNAPSDSVTVTNSIQTFWWEEMDDALSYNLIIVSPDFENQQIQELDTIVTANQVDVNMGGLATGSHQWKVIARHGQSRSMDTVRTFFTTGEVAIAEETVLPSSPSTGSVINNDSLVLNWEPLIGAVHYEVLWSQNLPLDETTAIPESAVCCQHIKNNLSPGATYFWRVRGIGESSSNKSKWSIPWSVTIQNE